MSEIADKNRQAPPATMTIFGAAGDLTKRVVVPALYNLVRAGRLPDKLSIIGVSMLSLAKEKPAACKRQCLPAWISAVG
jgi:glucose-6-phosphate 1-dehydrogenase